MTQETRSLHRKLAQVMLEAERIPKRGKAPAVMGGYPFVQVGDAADYIRKALAEQVISMVPSSIEVVGQVDRPTAKGGTMTTLDIRVEWTLTDGESGESCVIVSFGAGADGGDKYSGKAMTNAMKYALLAGFLLSTGDDTELTDTSHVLAQPVTTASVNAQERVRLVSATDAQERARKQDATLDNGDGSLIGTGELAKDFPDFLPKQSPEGGVLAFKLVSPAGGIKVIVHGDLAHVLPTLREEIIGKRISCWGRVRDETFTKAPKTGGKTFTTTYQVLDLERIRTESGTLPMVEAATAPLFTGPEFVE